ncbi:MAG: hypothetical protein Q9214_007944, partial [Letrouitia sp. 1 TL-2023]
HERPYANEEYKQEQNDAPSRCILRTPEVMPIATVRSRQPVILHNDHKEEPENDFAAEKRVVEGRDFTGPLTVIIWKPPKQYQPYRPEKKGNGRGDSCDCST